MFNFIVNLLSEDSKLSSVRLMSLLCILSGIFVGVYGIMNTKDLLGVSALVAAFLGPAFAAKVISKKDEK